MKSKKISMLLKSLLVISILAMIPVVSKALSLDLVAKVAVTSFEALTKAIPDKVAFDSTKGGWAIVGLDSKERIILSKDFSANTPNITVEYDAAPFIKAGLDVAKLPSDQYNYDAATGKITMPYRYGKDKFAVSAKKSVLETFRQLIKTHRDLIGYHEKLDHYGIALGNGNMFEWAKDMSTNDKDMVFVLNPQPFIDAGVDPAKV
ncbi:MAG TPA: hypothetical protein VHY08_17935, partial [Bacillota bacterium]|nr:hypothetical protein [Bacillota bacterium]